MPTIARFSTLTKLNPVIMEMDFTRLESVGYVFVPRQVANSIPFSSDKLSVILAQLSIDPESPKAQLMKDTLKYCNFPAGEGEVKTCATSLEAMIDFSIQRLGKNIQAVSTEPEKYAKLQNFTILPDVKRIGDYKAVSCHQMDYAYAVFYLLTPTMNTSSWNPEHLAFKVLNVKPGGEPVCHFFPQHHVLWTAQPHLAMPASDFY
uniref:BURP domain-containing protein n=2 Tax=Kalanchoe fedtschenkoi TaxID=63787 RepID=A0A7N0TCB3_KALFE